MANTLLIKRALAAGNAAPTALVQGELGYSYNSGNLFIGTEAGTGVLIIGGNTDHTALTNLGVAADYVSVAGDSMDSAANLTFVGGGEILGLPAVPSSTSAATSKAYVDAVAQGLNIHNSARVASTVNGTLATAFAAGSILDGVTLVAGDFILIKDQTSAKDNGCYSVTTGAPVREATSDTIEELIAAFYFIEEGTVNANTGWVSTVTTGAVLGTDPVNFAQFSGAGAFTAGNGLTLSGGVFSITSPVAVADGGTGLTNVGTAGQILSVVNAGGATAYRGLVGVGIAVDTSVDGTITLTATSGTVTGVSSTTAMAGLTLTTVTGSTTPVITLAGTLGIANGGTGLTAGGTSNQILGTNAGGTAAEYKTITGSTGLSVTNSLGGIALANTGVTSLIGTANEIIVSASTGAVTLSLPASTTTGSMTLTGLTANSFLFSGVGGLLTTTTAPTNGQILIGSTGLAPVAATLTAGTNITITNTAGTITIASPDAGGTVTSVAVSGGTTGLTTSGGPVTTNGTITFAGTLVPANGGTGIALTAGTEDQLLAVNAAGTGYDLVSIIDGGSF